MSLSLRAPAGRAAIQMLAMAIVRQPAVYIMASRRNGTLYTGVTSDLVRRVQQHKAKLTPGFASRYGCNTLVYYECCDDMIGAIEHEKRIKGGSRKKKLPLIEKQNPDWRDLYGDLV